MIRALGALCKKALQVEGASSSRQCKLHLKECPVSCVK